MSHSTDFQDSHLHLSHLSQEDIDNIVSKALNLNIQRLFANTAEEEEWAGAIQAGKRWQAVTPFLGIHPWYAAHATPGWQERLERISRETGCAIGEIGLDKKCRTETETQESVFKDQLEIAYRHGRPISIHCLGRWERTINMLQDARGQKQGTPLLFHSYSGSVETMQRLIRLGASISFSLQNLNQKKSFEVMLQTPLEHILLETDLSYQVQDKATKQKATIEHIILLYEKVAKARHISVKELCEQTWKNGSIFTIKGTNRRKKSGKTGST
ncbi:TatD family hydrolase [Desulfotalea psychrophila]|uniref:Uncharacterized protein n=1 Tax=Desulfotalea psychrophila (strain LSv54 / DSM 12343) TaxID=177439 RepID=Q6AS10_DESPS|nr:TatD family hydrolase [Desulfotalea psychrophila]CAG34865.1 hypothetical protein DP0136 [Desulfotalea psychrophila LSv54]